MSVFSEGFSGFGSSQEARLKNCVFNNDLASLASTC
jgi:hypothetical protein